MKFFKLLAENALQNRGGGGITPTGNNLIESRYKKQTIQTSIVVPKREENHN